MFEEKTIRALKWIIPILTERGIPYQISGGFAAHVYGSKRSVNDIDFDIPENRLTELVELFARYITHPLGHYVDGKWDMQLMTLVYEGQEIDIGGAESTKISTKDRSAWIPLPVDFSLTRSIDVEGLTLQIASPERMVAYKQQLDGEHQAADIAAMENYSANQPLS